MQLLGSLVYPATRKELAQFAGDTQKALQDLNLWGPHREGDGKRRVPLSMQQEVEAMQKLD